MNELPAGEAVVKLLVAEGRALSAGEIGDSLRVPRGGRKGLRRLLDELTLTGRVVEARGGKYRAARERVRSSEAWEGFLNVNPRGFGFVVQLGKDDVYVPAEAIGGAMHRDRVRVAVVGRSPRGLEGRIEAIVERRGPRVAGVLKRRARALWLEPDDTRIRGPIALPRGEKRGEDGEAAVVSITRWPESQGETPEAELVEVLGKDGDPNVEVAKILVREEVTEEHPREAIAEAEGMAAKVQRVVTDKRVDLRSVPLPTIDPEDARDHDDALWAERDGDGYKVWIAIADVSEYVQPGSALDQEALRRGCTIYLPDRAIPMLPSALAADLCSLLPEADRLCLCVIAELDKQAKVKRMKIVEGVMRSQARLTYEGVARALGFTEAPPRSAQAEAMKRELKVLSEVATKLRRARMARGALDLDLPEARIVVDPQTGAPTAIYRRTQDPGVKRAYQIVEELMLLANELVARWVLRRKAHGVFRVHGKPDEKKLTRLGEVSEKLGVAFDLDEMLTPLGLGRWLKGIHEHPRRQVLEGLLLRSLKQAAYDIANVGHFGLASDAYLHFTSPIRRYPDVLVHRQVKHLLRGGQVDVSDAAKEALATAATRSSQRERSVMDVEREVSDLYRALFMQDRVGQEFEGMVTAVVGSGLFVSLDDPFVDVLVRYEALGPDRYEMSEDELGAYGLTTGDLVQIGDRMRVVIEDVAILRRQVLARRVLGAGEGAEAQGRGRGRGRGRVAQSRGEAPRQEAPRRARGAVTTTANRPGPARPKSRAKASKQRRKR
ncbi:MAG: ribonuclease R [Polyangiaceae bacterium]|nr:ribonuclease R [Polyangiaceae bacterium]MCW5790151.1 ribonuclease R [Polyangiaceae bacterium]